MSTLLQQRFEGEYITLEEIGIKMPDKCGKCNCTDLRSVLIIYRRTGSYYGFIICNNNLCQASMWLTKDGVLINQDKLEWIIVDLYPKTPGSDI